MLFPSAGFVEASHEEIADLHARISQTTGLKDVALESRGDAGIEMSFPARNARETGRVQRLIDTQVDGWNVGEISTYALPKSL
jgi:hypothetical protein